MNKNDFQTGAVDLVAKLAPWLAPAPTAYLVGKSTVLHLAWPLIVAIMAGLIVECLGLATTVTALELYQYNAEKRKTDPSAPFALAVALVLVYFITATGLTVLLDIVPGLALYAPAIFPVLSLAGVTILALRADHRRRLLAIETVKQERKAARRASVKVQAEKVSNNIQNRGNLDKMQAGRQAKIDTRIDNLLDIYLDNPRLSPSEAARRLKVSRQTVYTYLSNLENAGRIHRNGNGVEVLG